MSITNDGAMPPREREIDRRLPAGLFGDGPSGAGAGRQATSVMVMLAEIEANPGAFAPGAMVGACLAARQEIEMKTRVIENFRMSVIAFCVPYANAFAKQLGMPPGHLHPDHYDILADAGARMDDFTRGD